MKKSDWVIVVLGAAKGKRLTPAQLQKSLFLIKQNIPKDLKQDFYDFEPYNYGPFCAEIYLNAEKFSNEELVKISWSKGIRWREYSATTEGIKRYNKIIGKLPKDIVKFIEELVKDIRNLSFQQLISYIYKNYPEYKENSIFIS